MKKENSALKELILQAKLRMREGLYKGGKVANKKYGTKAEYLADYRLKLISSCEEEKVANKIISVLKEEGIVVNPIEKIIDKEYYNSLDEIAKSRYVIGLSQKYKKFKEKFELGYNYEPLMQA